MGAVAKNGAPFALAAISGARTFLGPALAARRAGAGRKLRLTMAVLAACELLGDKLPGIPARTTAVPLLGRAVSGAAVALAGRRRDTRRAAGLAALAGAAVALASAFATLRIRRALIRAFGGTPLGNALAGTLEDLALLGLGRAVTG